MIYDITLKITHEYVSPVGRGRHVLRLVPADVEGRQSCRTHLLEVSPLPVERYAQTDYFQNKGTVIVHTIPHSEMVLKLKTRVACIARDQQLDITPNRSQLAEELRIPKPLGPHAPHHFLGVSPRLPRDVVLGDYARAQISPGMNVRDIVVAIGQALHRDMTFKSGSTTVDTPPKEAFAQRKGVCQDYSHIMISCLREVGIPAGYVSGFLRTLPPPGKARLEGADAMHAWVRAWCGVDAGWVEYDPTNATFAGTDHILIGYGRDYTDISPVKGVLRAAGGQKTTQSVDVAPLGSDPPSGS